MRRFEGYRRLVAALPCINCGIGGASQAAHPNTGKAKGRKQDDRLCFPLCHIGANACHWRFDLYELHGKERQRELEPVWAAQTRATLQAEACNDRSVRRVLERMETA